MSSTLRLKELQRLRTQDCRDEAPIRLQSGEDDKGAEPISAGYLQVTEECAILSQPATVSRCNV